MRHEMAVQQARCETPCLHQVMPSHGTMLFQHGMMHHSWVRRAELSRVVSCQGTGACH